MQFGSYCLFRQQNPSELGGTADVAILSKGEPVPCGLPETHFTLLNHYCYQFCLCFCLVLYGTSRRCLTEEAPLMNSATFGYPLGLSMNPLNSYNLAEQLSWLPNLRCYGSQEQLQSSRSEATWSDNFKYYNRLASKQCYNTLSLTAKVPAHSRSHSTWCASANS